MSGLSRGDRAPSALGSAPGSDTSDKPMSGLSRGDRAPSALGSAPGSESERGEFISDINVTPFVDVMLVLLVIFMVTTPALLPLLKLDLPGTQAGATLERQQTGDVNHLLFELAADGSMRLNREPVEREALLAERLKTTNRRCQPLAFRTCSRRQHAA